MLVGLNGSWFSNCPKSGIVHFDYASTKRPLLGAKPISAARFQKMVHKLGITDIPVECERVTGDNFVQRRLISKLAILAEPRVSFLLAREISSNSSPNSPRSSALSLSSRASRRGLASAVSESDRVSELLRIIVSVINVPYI